MLRVTSPQREWLRTHITPELLLVVGIVYLAALLRFFALGEKSFWLDEATSITIARLDWPSLVSAVMHQEPNMSLYYGLLHLWRHLGEREATLRSLSAIAAVATIPTVYAIGRRAFDARVGLLAALFLAVNAFDIRYAQEARSYALLVFLTSLATLALARSVERPSRSAWSGYVLISVASVYSHFFAALVLLAHVVSLAFLRRRILTTQALICLGLVALLTVPLGIAASHVTGAIGGIPKPSLPGIYYTLMAITGAGGWLLLLAYALACLLACGPIWRAWTSASTSVEAWRYGVVVAWLLVPILAALGISLIKPVFSARYLVVCLPPLSILAAIGVTRIRPRWASVGAAVAIVALSAHGIQSYFVYFPKENWRTATQFIIAQSRPTDAVLFYPPYVREPFDYYRDDTGHTDPTVVFPERPFVRALANPVTTPQQSVDAVVDELPARYDRVWLVVGRNEMGTPDDLAGGRALLARLTQPYPIVRTRRFFGILVLLCAKPDYLGRKGP
ncbi:MAG TPA: glycosyltransferase family 39 protein [bacterium]|nr:glycosyltransferase family 39 protein [bacterium]